MSTPSVAIVTGASRGIGRAIALELARQGHAIAFNYRSNEEAANSLAAEIEALGVPVLAAQVDVGDFTAVRAFFDQVLDRFDSFQVLVNNAGITRDRYLMRMAPEDWQAVIDTNLTGAFNCARAAIVPLMKQRAGSIVNISSTGGVMGMAGQVNYSASKAGLIGLTMALAKEVARYGITVNAVAPGFIETDMTENLGKIAEEVKRQIPVGRIGEPWEVAKAVSFLVSENARYITGQVIVIDGGLTIQGGHVTERG